MSTRATVAGSTLLARGSPVRNFGRHFVEMVVAMVAGMAVLGGALAGVLELAGSSYASAERDAGALVALAMAVSMTAPMAAWMRHRRHSWPRIAEMAGAMLLLTLVVVGLLAAGAVSGKQAVDAQHTAMVPVMLGVMLLRRRAYTRGVHAADPPA